MDESEKLYNERQKMESALSDVVGRKAALGEDPETRSTAIDLLVERVIGVNDSKIKELQAKLDSKKKVLEDEERPIRMQLKESRRAMEALTRPQIYKAIYKLQSEINGLKISGM